MQGANVRYIAVLASHASSVSIAAARRTIERSIVDGCYTPGGRDNRRGMPRGDARVDARGEALIGERATFLQST